MPVEIADRIHRRSKADSSQHLIADWQCLRNGPVGQDWVTFIGTIDPAVVPPAVQREIIGKYHAALSAATNGDAGSEYALPLGDTSGVLAGVIVLCCALLCWLTPSHVFATSVQETTRCSSCWMTSLW